MSGETELITVVVLAEVLPATVFLYAAYWSFAIRRALVSTMYRRQAMWLGLLAVALAVTMFVTYSSDFVVEILINLYIALLFAFVFAYVDSVIPVARRSDPLLRDILHWRRTRYFLWFDVALLGAFNELPSLFPSLSVGEIGLILQDLGWFAAAAILFGFSGIALFIGARRSRDMTLNSSLKWIGVVLLLTIVLFVVDTIESASFTNLSYDAYAFYYSYTALPSGAVSIATAYGFYRAARALAPVGKIQGES